MNTAEEVDNAGSIGCLLYTSAMTNSIANGNEQVHIIVRIHLLRGYEDILMNEQVLIRGNLDYYEMVEHARRLQKKLKQYLA